jgi:predicted membrane protein
MENINNDNKEQSREKNKIIGGIIIVAVGIVLLMRNMGVLLPYWLFTWPVILILVGIYSGFKHNFKNNSWLIITGVGVFFWISKFIPSLHLEPFFWPLVIIAIGIIYILKPSKKSWNGFKRLSDGKDNIADSSWKDVASDEGYEGNDKFKITSIFSGVKRNIISKNFKRGQVTSVFGGAEIDMSQADMMGPSIIKVEVAFGGVSIVVPSNWSVQNDIQGVFHGVEDKRYNATATIDPNKVLVLKGSCAFGGVEIKSY